MKKYKIIDFVNCAICGHSEQYNDDTFICTLGDTPLTYSECGELEFSKDYLVGFLTLLTKLIREMRD